MQPFEHEKLALIYLFLNTINASYLNKEPFCVSLYKNSAFM